MSGTEIHLENQMQLNQMSDCLNTVHSTPSPCASCKLGQRAKVYPTRMNGYENDEATELFRQF